MISQTPQGKKRGFAGDPRAPEGAQRGTWAGARVAARGFPRVKELLNSSVASTRGDPGAICSLTRSSFSFYQGGRPWVLRQDGVRALKATWRRTRLCDALGLPALYRLSRAERDSGGKSPPAPCWVG